MTVTEGKFLDEPHVVRRVAGGGTYRLRGKDRRTSTGERFSGERVGNSEEF